MSKILENCISASSDSERLLALKTLIHESYKK